MFNFLEKFFFKRIIKKLVPMSKKLWEKHKDDLEEKAKEAIKNVIKRTLEK